MDESNVQLMNAVENLRRKIEEDDSTHSLQRFLFEHKHDPEYVAKFYKAFIPMQRTHCANVYKAFSDFFFQARFYDDMTELFSLWVEFLVKDYNVEGCMRFLGYFTKLHESISASVKQGEIYGKTLETLLSLSWLLNRNGALFESYVVCEKICEMITAVGKPSSKATAISYLELLCDFFIESSMLFSYVNAVNTLVTLDCNTIAKQCSLEDLRLLCSYSEIKNEGDKHRKLFCKIRFSMPKEIIANVEERCSNIEVQMDTLVKRKFDFCMWKRYMNSLKRYIPVEENMDLIVFMKKNDFTFSMNDGMVKAGEFEYKTIERKIFEIVGEYQEKARPVSKPIAIERIKRQETPLAPKKEKSAQLKKTTKFTDRFTLPWKKMRLYSEYYMKNAQGMEDPWYEKRNSAAREAFERTERMSRQNRDELKAYEDIVERLRTELAKKIEEASKKVEEYISPRSSSRSHWKDEADETSKLYRPPVYQKNLKAYAPPSDAYKSSPSRYVPPSSSQSMHEGTFRETQRSSSTSQRSRASRNNSWYSDDSRNVSSDKKDD